MSTFNKKRKKGSCLGKNKRCLLHLLSITESTWNGEEQSHPHNKGGKSLFILTTFMQGGFSMLSQNGHWSTDIGIGFKYRNFWKHTVMGVMPRRSHLATELMVVLKQDKETYKETHWRLLNLITCQLCWLHCGETQVYTCSSTLF